jgi:hypothetical protein
VSSPPSLCFSVGRERVFGFVEACQTFGHLLTADCLSSAYRSAGRLFQSRLAATFLVLRDGDQPVSNFFVPRPRVVAAPTEPVASASVVAPVVQTNVPPPPLLNYLQRALSAPVPSGSGSGRKRPAEAEVLESNSKR